MVSTPVLVVSPLTMRRCSSSGTALSANTATASAASTAWCRPVKARTKPMMVRGMAPS
jgi:hypothetical protein